MIDVPSDAKALDFRLTGEFPESCEEIDRVGYELVRGVGDKWWRKPICPEGCVRTVDDVKRKCGIKYYGG